MAEHIVVRYGEIVLKGKNRTQFERVLERNLQQALSKWPAVKVSRSGSRMMIALNGEPEDEVLAAAANVFGIFSLSPVDLVALDMGDITAAALRLLTDAKRENPHLQTFKVECSRGNKQFPLTSPVICQNVGGDLLEQTDGWTVDVHHPDLTVNVFIGHVEAMVYGKKVAAVGGLPVGTAGKVLLLLSGGIDSPVAGWLALKRGVEVEAIHFHSYPFTSERALQKVETLAQMLADWGGRVRLSIISFTEIQTEIRKHCPEPLSVTIMRRMMMRIAAQVADRRKLLALVTGESLGQVASQTLDSMRTINAVTNLPVLRPLVAEDKVDIIRRARVIGTYETSILPYEDCCTVFLPKKPRTRPQPEEAAAAEAGLDVESLVARAVETAELKTFVSSRD